MRIRLVDVIKAGIVNNDRRDDGDVHLSEVIHFMTIKMGKYLEKELSEEDFHRFKVGFSWEAGVLGEGILIDTISHHAHTIPALLLRKDGIRMTTDGADFRCGHIFECKATWYGLGKTILDPVFSHYHWQGKAYALAAELRKVLYPFVYVMGDYRENRRPTFRAWECTYSQNELTKNWSMIQRERDNMLKEREAR